MPSSITHAYFAEDIYKDLPPNCQNKIRDNIDYFKLFAQGSDPFMFFHFFIGKKAKVVANIQKRMHTTQTRAFFLTTIKTIQEKNLVHCPEVMTYLYGYICHYFLDLYIHPFIYYQSGIFRKEDPTTYPYNTLHQRIEYRIDSYIIKEKLKKDPKKFKVHDYLFQNKDFSDELKMIIQESIGKVYKVPACVFLYKKSIWYMENFFHHVNYDPFGIKVKIYRGIDRITPKNITRLEELSYYTEEDGTEYLNLVQEKWYDPWCLNHVHTASFWDLYQLAKKDASRAIIKVTSMLEKKKIDLEQLKTVFQDLSFATGLPCEKKVKFQYFKF